MRQIGIIYNPHSASSIQLSEKLKAWLQSQGVGVWRGASHEGREHPAIIENMDLLIAMGGDGTVLRAAHLAISLTGCSVPVLPVALGRLNFMAELTPDELYNGITTLLEGRGWYDKRTLLEAFVQSECTDVNHVIALNEIVVARGEINRVLTIDVEIYDAKLATYHADGVVVATATGSTAYALSCGGPIIDPRSRALSLVPIAAHLTHIPSLVLHEDATMTLRLRGRHHASFSADGHEAIPLCTNDVVHIRQSSQMCVFARVHPPSTFYARMARRLRRE
ncbi:MAG: NAD(+)/NADH kinase [Chloroflexota bacterium]